MACSHWSPAAVLDQGQEGLQPRLGVPLQLVPHHVRHARAVVLGGALQSINAMARHLNHKLEVPAQS